MPELFDYYMWTAMCLSDMREDVKVRESYGIYEIYLNGQLVKNDPTGHEKMIDVVRGYRCSSPCDIEDTSIPVACAYGIYRAIDSIVCACNNEPYAKLTLTMGAGNVSDVYIRRIGRYRVIRFNDDQFFLLLPDLRMVYIRYNDIKNPTQLLTMCEDSLIRNHYLDPTILYEKFRLLAASCSCDLPRLRVNGYDAVCASDGVGIKIHTDAYGVLEGTDITWSMLYNRACLYAMFDHLEETMREGGQSYVRVSVSSRSREDIAATQKVAQLFKETCEKYGTDVVMRKLMEE